MSKIKKPLEWLRDEKIKAPQGSSYIPPTFLLRQCASFIEEYNNKIRVTKLIELKSDVFDLVECCRIGPITNENYCPNCGAKILR